MRFLKLLFRIIKISPLKVLITKYLKGIQSLRKEQSFLLGLRRHSIQPLTIYSTMTC